MAAGARPPRPQKDPLADGQVGCPGQSPLVGQEGLVEEGAVWPARATTLVPDG